MINTQSKSAFYRWKLWLLPVAWLLAGILYGPLIGAGWFYDDGDYVLHDPRLSHLELFTPAHWSDPPPPLPDSPEQSLILPGYDKPLIADRYLFHLSFALERKLTGGTPSPAVSHAVNLFLHLACVSALFFVLLRLTQLYLGRLDEFETNSERNVCWRIFPGLGALIFSIHPWAAEPVCYATARNGSLGTLFVLMGLLCWLAALNRARSGFKRAVCILLSLLCALAAFGSKENFITAPAGYLLVTWPLLWLRVRLWSKLRVAILFFSVAAVVFVFAVLGIKASERAGGLWAQIGDGRGWRYFFEIQNPLLLSTLADQIPVQRLSLEANHPHWAMWACLLALAVNGILILGSLIGGFRWPMLLGLSWFYLHLLPTNSFLPRPDFLAARNVYLPVAGTSALLAGFFVWVWNLSVRCRVPKIRVAVVGMGSLLILYWAASTASWARAFLEPEQVWARSALVAPDHSLVRLQLAQARWIRHLKTPTADLARIDRDVIRRECFASLAADDSPTMAWHMERPKAVQRAVALLYLGFTYKEEGNDVLAEHYFRQSCTQQILVEAWVGWISACRDGIMTSDAKMFESSWREAIALGFERWPQDWWPLVARGLLRVEQFPEGHMPPEVLSDFEAAEKAPNATLLELRSLQSLALYYLAQAEGRLSPRVIYLLKRLEHLGLPKTDIARLRSELQTMR